MNQSQKDKGESVKRDRLLYILSFMNTFLAIYVSINFIGLNNSVTVKVRNEVETQLYDKNYMTGVEIVLAHQCIKTEKNYGSEIWALNGLFEYLHQNNPRAAQSLVEQMQVSYENKSNKKNKSKLIINGPIKQFLFDRLDFLLKKSRKAQKDEEEKSIKKQIEGTLWSLHHLAAFTTILRIHLSESVRPPAVL